MTATQVGLLASLAWRDEGKIRLVLHLPEIVPTSVEVRFRDGDRRVRRPATVAPAQTGVLVEVEADSRALSDGLWRIAVRLDDVEEFLRVQARLLVRPGMPIALLPGPEPETRLPEPIPSPVTSSLPARAVGFARRAVGGVRRRVGR